VTTRCAAWAPQPSAHSRVSRPGRSLATSCTPVPTARRGSLPFGRLRSTPFGACRQQPGAGLRSTHKRRRSSRCLRQSRFLRSARTRRGTRPARGDAPEALLRPKRSLSPRSTRSLQFGIGWGESGSMTSRRRVSHVDPEPAEASSAGANRWCGLIPTTARRRDRQ
jgi:hypothetical protein